MTRHGSSDSASRNRTIEERERRALFDEIEAEALETGAWSGFRRFDPHIMEAMAQVPRPAFVPAGEQPYAWLNRALPIGHRQTISQPFIVALMTNLLQPEADDIVLEIGTGSGYQAAVLSELVSKVYSIELDPDLAAGAADRLERLGYANVTVRAGDGAAGWPEHAPFDGIIVTAAATEIPKALVDQLRPGGRMVVPVTVANGQELLVLHKTGEGIETKSVLPVAFVPLRTGD